MNVYGWVILSALLGTYALSQVAELRNLRALREDLPAEFAGVYNRETYRRSQAYTRSRTSFGMLTATVDLVVLLAFWFAGGFEWLDGLVRSLGWGPVPTGALFIGVLVLAQSALSLPFHVYATFVIEARYGFNRTTPRTFAADRLKALALAVLLGGPAVMAFIALFEYAGSWAWLYAWLAAVLLTLALQYVLPTWIMPLFNRFSPLEPGELRDALFAYARSVAFPLRNVVVMDGSRRSSKANAFFTGFGRNKRIALFDTLIAAHSTRELVAVIAHEVGHYKGRHGLKGLGISVVHVGLLFALLAVFLTDERLFAAFSVETPSVYAGLVFFVLLLTPVDFLLGIGLHALSRRHERQADGFSARTTGGPADLVSALKVLSRDSLTNLTPDPLYVALNYSHPPVLERIAWLRSMAATSVRPGVPSVPAGGGS